MPIKTKSIEVVAAIIYRRGKVLACQRKETGPFPFKWEFAGGKVEPGEEPEAALLRELNEELGIETLGATEILAHRHRYPNGLDVNIRFYRVDRYHGRPANRVFRKIRWVPRDRLGELDFLEGDVPVIERIVGGKLTFE